MSKVYVDTDAMSQWKIQMESINKNCIDQIDKIDSAMNSLSSSFQGDYAEKFENSFGQYTKSVRNSHESLRSVEKFLDTIVEVMNNQ